MEEVVSKPLLTAHPVRPETSSLEQRAISTVPNLRESPAAIAVFVQIHPRCEFVEVIEPDPRGEYIPLAMERVLGHELGEPWISLQLRCHRHIDRCEIPQRTWTRGIVIVDRRIDPVEGMSVTSCLTEGQNVRRSARAIIPVKPGGVRVEVVTQPRDRVPRVELSVGLIDQVLSRVDPETELEIVGSDAVPGEEFFVSFERSDIHFDAGITGRALGAIDESSLTCTIGSLQLMIMSVKVVGSTESAAFSVSAG